VDEVKWALEPSGKFTTKSLLSWWRIVERWMLEWQSYGNPKCLSKLQSSNGCSGTIELLLVINSKSEKAKVLRGANTVGSLKLEIIYFSTVTLLKLSGFGLELVWDGLKDQPLCNILILDAWSWTNLLSNTRDSWLDPAPCV